MSTSPFDPVDTPRGAEPSPFGAEPSPFGAEYSPFGAEPSPFGAVPTEPPAPSREAPFADTPTDHAPARWAAGPGATAWDTAETDLFEAAAAVSAEVRPSRPAGSLDSAAAPFGLPQRLEPPGAAVPAPRSAADDVTGAPAPPTAAVPAAAPRRRVSPVLAVAVAGGAVLAGVLGALALTSGVDDESGQAVVAAAPRQPAGPSRPATEGPVTAGPGGGAAVEAAFTPNPRDPFAALVSSAAAAGPAETGTANGASVSGAQQGTAGSSSGGVQQGTASGATGTGVVGGTGSQAGSSGSQAGSSSSQSGSSGSASTSPLPTALTRAQVCTAVTDPMNQVEQLLTNSASGSTSAVDAGLALRTPVAVLRTAVGLTSDSRLAGRLDIAASTAEALRAQLIAGTAVTSGQVATQVSRDADVRSACA